ncbi:MAG: ribulose-phosphate 3-epimerase [Bacillaceae bacterium G1]|nr:ribulose-phosphate 3-epimerase [Bacillota bacterium]OJF17439.1 MAG: ribulose-phosphate 3-epimerase [Bacillaceae bacterium G1]
MKIAPSILSANFAYLADELQSVADADWIHIDVMDGHFVPNITMGPLVVKALRPLTDKPLDVHLMITDPDKYIPVFAESGADWITVHVEATVHLQRTLALIRAHGKKAGVALNPATPIHGLEYVLDDVDLILLMTVNPGFGGQAFLPAVLDKIRAVRELLDRKGYSHIEIEVDGGIDDQTAPLVREAGATVAVSGSYIFRQENRAQAIQALRDKK